MTEDNVKCLAKLISEDVECFLREDGYYLYLKYKDKIFCASYPQMSKKEDVTLIYVNDACRGYLDGTGLEIKPEWFYENIYGK